MKGLEKEEEDERDREIQAMRVQSISPQRLLMGSLLHRLWSPNLPNSFSVLQVPFLRTHGMEQSYLLSIK